MRVLTSIAIPRRVLATTTASAPASSAARAIAAISPVFGVSFAHSGSAVRARMAAIAATVSRTDMANAMPSASRFGQEMLASIAATPGTESSAQACPNSSAVSADTLTTSGVSQAPNAGTICSRKCRRPLLGMPIELSMPASVSQTRGVGLPVRSLGVTLLVTQAPSRAKSMTRLCSSPNVPDAGISGFFRVRPPMVTRISTMTDLPCAAGHDLAQVEHRSFTAHAPVQALAADLELAHAAQAHTESAGHLLLQRRFAAQVIFAAEPLRKHKQPRRTAGVEHVRALGFDQTPQQRLDPIERGGPVAVEHGVDLGSRPLP